jgi:hypothetical protein
MDTQRFGAACARRWRGEVIALFSSNGIRRITPNIAIYTSCLAGS